MSLSSTFLTCNKPALCEVSLKVELGLVGYVHIFLWLERVFGDWWFALKTAKSRWIDYFGVIDIFMKWDFC